MAIFQQGSFQIGPNETPESIAKKRAMIQSLMMNYGSASNIGEGIGHLFNGIGVGMANRKTAKAEQAGMASGQAAQSKILEAMMGGGSTPSSSQPAVAPSQSASPSEKAPISATGVDVAKRLQADFGLSPGAAAGFAGNLAHESGDFKTLQEINPVVAGSRGGFGWAQWTGPRRRAFESWSAQNGLDPASPEANYGFLKNELQNTPEGSVLAALKGVNDPSKAAEIVSNKFLRPGIPHMESRVSKSQKIAQALMGGTEVASLDPSIGMASAYSPPQQQQSGVDKVFSAIMPQSPPQPQMQPATPQAARGASGMDVWQGRANQGTATDGTTLTRLPDGSIQRTNRFGVTERMSPEGKFMGMVDGGMGGGQSAPQPQQVAQSAPMSAPQGQPTMAPPQASAQVAQATQTAQSMQPQQPQQQGGVNLQAIMEAAQNPFTPEPVRKMALDFIQNEQMKQSPEYQAEQQMKQLQLQKSQFELQKMQNPDARFENIGGRLVQINPDGTVKEAYAPPPEPVKEPAKPAEIQEYEYAKGQGFPGTFQDWKASQKGGMALQVDPATGQVTFQQGGNIKPMTEAQSKDTVYAVRAEGALPLLDSMDRELAGVQGNTLGQLPVIGNFLKPEAFQKAEQASNEFLQALLRKDTGAVITEGEQVLYGNTYIPRMGDGPEVIEQKIQSRYRALQAMKAGMTPQAILAQEQALKKSGNEVMPSQAAQQVQTLPQAAPKRLKFNPATGELE
jgi:hypothetical protein